MKTKKKKVDPRIPASQDRRFAMAVARIAEARVKRIGAADTATPARRVGTQTTLVRRGAPEAVSGSPAVMLGLRFSIPEDRIVAFDDKGAPKQYLLFDGVKKKKGGAPVVGTGSYGRDAFDVFTGIVWLKGDGTNGGDAEI